ncbi:S-layer homology domain-containing protein [Paenibacillus doosanensis]|uniref:S-layer homology domain-containing protein n=1 Tax=Paenibacillus doosanensis TaxID=1229154 RepID=UPI00217F5FF0|nr:S-layer homology domain-containing protein [Paenibacillus doosanensis]MCS7458814.1 S-layer homology domain-containing protein [Paenibacillus doosanensis]
MKKTIAGMIVGLSLFISISSANAAPALSDVNGHWAKDQIEFALKDGFVDGYPDGTFRPDQNVSRVEFLKLVVDALKFKKQDAAGEWFQPYVKTAEVNGIHQTGEFAADQLNEPITREEMARIAVRATGEANYDAKKWMYLATSKGIITGMDEAGTLGEDQPTTRAQAVTVIRRIMKIREGASLPADKYATSAAEIYWHKTNIITMLPQYFADGYLKRGQKLEESSLKYVGENGYSEIEKYIVVDMDNVKDPNRKLIPTDFRWSAAFGAERTPRQDNPNNSYALLSFNHIDVSVVEPISFRFAQLNINPFFSENTVDEEGNLIDVTRFSSYDERNKTYLGSSIKLNVGENDLRFVTGQLLPKAQVRKQGDQFYLYRDPAQELGESHVVEVFSSHIDYTLK